MRIMEGVLDHHDLTYQLDALLVEHTGNTNFWLGEDEFMDEPSDAEDPEATLRAENAALRGAAADQSAIVQAAQQELNAAACRQMLSMLAWRLKTCALGCCEPKSVNLLCDTAPDLCWREKQALFASRL